MDIHTVQDTLRNNNNTIKFGQNTKTLKLAKVGQHSETLKLAKVGLAKVGHDLGILVKDIVSRMSFALC